MRWDALFADLEAQWEAGAAEERDREIAEAVRAERATVPFADRLRAQRGERVSMIVAGAGSMVVDVDTVGEDWLAGAEGHVGVLVPLEAVLAVDGLPRRAQEETSPTRRRLRMTSALRALGRDRAVVSLLSAQADVLATGLLAAVGRDHVDVARTRPGETPRAREGHGLRTVPLSAITLVRSEDGPVM